MLYVIDTNIFRKLLDHFPKKGAMFEVIWEKIDNGIREGVLISVDECFNELTRHFDEKNNNYRWLNERKKMFQNPTNVESLIIRELFRDAKVQESIHKKNILENRPSADIYLVAKAKALNGIIVTAEEYKPHSAQLPNLCEKCDVPCISYDDFMDALSRLS